MTLVFGSVQLTLTITRVQPRMMGERLRQELAPAHLERQIEAIRHEVYRHMALSPQRVAFL